MDGQKWTTQSGRQTSISETLILESENYISLWLEKKNGVAKKHILVSPPLSIPLGVNCTTEYSTIAFSSLQYSKLTLNLTNSLENLPESGKSRQNQIKSDEIGTKIRLNRT